MDADERRFFWFGVGTTDLLEVNPELRWSLVLNAYLDEEINLGKAAELLDMHELELRRQFLELGVPLRIGPADVAEAEAEVSIGLEALEGKKR